MRKAGLTGPRESAAATGRRLPAPGRGAVALRSLAAVSLLAALLASCLQPPPPPPPADPLVARADGGNTPSATVDLAPGEWEDFELVLDSVRSFDLAYAELDTTQPAVVELRGGTYWTVIASSSTPNYFVRGAISGVPRPVPSAAAEELEPATIATNVVCRGPCVLFDPGSGKFYLRVVNTGSTGLVADLYLYGASFSDEHEPANDRRTTAPRLQDGESGALELLGDVDYWLADAEANVRVQPVSGGLAIEATVYDGCGLAVAGPYDGGEAFRVYPGEAVRVRAAQNRAAPAGRSRYDLLVSAPSGAAAPRDLGCTEVVANTNPDAPVANVFLSGGATATFLVDVPSSVRSRDVIQFEVSGAARLEVLSGGTVLYSSTSADVFFAGSLAATAAPELEPAAVSVARVCAGPCVIEPGPAPDYTLRVTNLGSGRNVQVFAFGRSFDDTTEPDNDSRATAPAIADDSGAIEFVGDVDYWYVPATGTVKFETVVGGVPLVADIVGPVGNVISANLQPGNLAVQAGEFLRVRAANANAAAVAGRSTYFLYY